MCAKAEWNGFEYDICIDDWECKNGSIDAVVDCGNGKIHYT